MSRRSVITFHFTLRDPEGRVLDTTRGGEPLTILEGGGQVIEGLEQALRSLPPGARSRVAVPAAQAYGEREEGQVQRLPRAALPIQGELKPGDRFQAGPDRHAPIVTVVEVSGDDVLLDANHPLAGLDLVFDVEVVAVRPFTASPNLE